MHHHIKSGYKRLSSSDVSFGQSRTGRQEDRHGDSSVPPNFVMVGIITYSQNTVIHKQ